MHITASQAFGFALDILCVCFTFVVTFSFLITEFNGSNGALVGLAISQSTSLTAMLQWGIRRNAEVMNQLTAVERVLEYSELEKEEKEVQKVADKSWPERGKLKFQNVFYRYAKDMEPALRDVSFEVDACEKIGIVGRTGVSLKIINIQQILFQIFFRLENLH